MSVDSKAVDYVTYLAKLYLDDDERDRMAEQLATILEYVDHLREVDVGDVPPTKHVINLTNVSREDVTRPSLPREESLANSPDSVLGYFAVPKVLPD
jgi:aspartyl-tRNA(Asn)/glutamyl-tRNA(Gln) amidotransferase subunit C